MARNFAFAQRPLPGGGLPRLTVNERLQAASSSPVAGFALGGLVIAIGLAISIVISGRNLSYGVGAGALLMVGGWCLLSSRYEVTLGVVLMYLALLDGYLKLKFGSNLVTAGRDILVWLISLGALMRWSVHRQKLMLPPLTGFLIAWTIVVVIQLANPLNAGTVHAIQSLRPHLEFVPLFFFGFLIMRTRARMRGFLLLIVIAAAINGIVNLYQSGLSTLQFAAWGPGYHARIFGGAGFGIGISPRTYVNALGITQVRPFGLGSDIGFGGTMCVIGLPASLALIGLRREPVFRLLGALMGICVVIGVYTSQTRTAVLAALVGALAYVSLTVVAHQRARSVVRLIGVVILIAITLQVVTNASSQGSFSRYDSITPNRALDTAYNYRIGTITDTARYFRQYPFGAGIGSVGPAGALSANGADSALDGESEFTTLVLETGIPGFVVMITFLIVLMRVTFQRVRRIEDADIRLLLAGIAAPLVAMVAAGYTGPTTLATPYSPYLWFVAGILSWWLIAAPKRAQTAVLESRIADLWSKATESQASDAASPSTGRAAE